MSSAQDPFYIVKEEIQESIDTLQGTFHQWEHIPVASAEQTRLTKELLSSCESIEWQVEELEKAISVASRDPALYGINQAELDRRTKWTRTARTQVGNVKKSVTGSGYSTSRGMREELMRLPNTRHQDQASHYVEDNDDFITSESDRQMLLIRQQDEELDELSASVERIGSVGLTIHDELHTQEKLIDELGSEMDSTTNRLDFVQKKVAVVMKKVNAKGQMMMILFLIVLFIILFVLVFFT
ncbi:putative target SNARE coiled-coil domain, syntaxin/epimorphin, syntaxin 6 [Helianthus annuus]|nr:putative target SNARE coiled-coil domain, syntaxin/epimorphin, syntaxin 6 [Helianthus annuus]